jgi:hypothetical protein
MQPVIQAPPVAKKYQSRVDSTTPTKAPPVAAKFKARVAGDQDVTAAPDASAPVAPLSQAAPATAATACPNPIAPNALSQASDLSKTLNQTLANVKPTEVARGGPDDPLNWEDDDYIDSKDMAKLGTHEKPKKESSEDQTSGALSPFVKKLLTSATKEVNRKCRVIDGRNICRTGSKRACLQGVRMAFEEANGDPLKGWTNKAKDAGPFLKKYGYSKSAKGKYTVKTAPVGSVMIYDVPGHASQAGHIEIKGTDGYYSDFYEKNPITAKLGNLRRLIAIWVPPTT